VQNIGAVQVSVNATARDLAQKEVSRFCR
jgi:hypothetical protein